MKIKSIKIIDFSNPQIDIDKILKQDETQIKPPINLDDKKEIKKVEDREKVRFKYKNGER